jgi:hypothetical protein
MGRTGGQGNREAAGRLNRENVPAKAKGDHLSIRRNGRITKPERIILNAQVWEKIFGQGRQRKNE